MWDIIVPLILMAIFYLLLEILKRKRRQEEYKYPEIPGEVPPPVETRPPAEERRPAERPLPQPAPARVPMPDIVLPPADEERPRPVFVHRPPEPNPKPVEPNYMPKETPVAAAADEACPWDGRLDQAAVVNGIIFAEIIQPPRCKRPLHSPFQR